MVKSNAPLLPPDITGPLTERLNNAQKLIEILPDDAAAELLDIVLTETSNDDTLMATENSSKIVEQEDPSKVREAAIYVLGELNAKRGDPQAIQQLFETIRPFFNTIPKARTAKIVRNFIDMLSQIPNASIIQEKLCFETIEWCKEEKRTFLRYRVATRLALLYYQSGRYSRGMEIVTELLRDVKRLDDKLLLVEIHYIEAKLYFSTKNIAKAKAALTAARSNANAIHCPPLLQADIDVMAGAIHLEEGDAKTGFSYFFEAFEAFNIAEDSRAHSALKYMMLAKIMSNQSDDVNVLSKQKQYVKYAGREIEAFKMIASSYHQRDLQLLEKTFRDYKQELQDDPIIERHTNELYQTLLEQNVLKVIEPFSKVEVEHVAKLMQLPIETIQLKLAEMILDKKLSGTLDQGSGILILFDEPSVPSVYSDGIEVFNNLAQIVELLHRKAQKVL